MLVSQKTKVDILGTPAVTVFTGVLTAHFVSPFIARIMYWLGAFVNTRLANLLPGPQNTG